MPQTVRRARGGQGDPDAVAKTDDFRVRVAPDVSDAFREAAERRGLSVAAWLRELGIDASGYKATPPPANVPWLVNEDGTPVVAAEPASSDNGAHVAEAVAPTNDDEPESPRPRARKPRAKKTTARPPQSASAPKPATIGTLIDRALGRLFKK